MTQHTIKIEKIPEPAKDCSGIPICLTDETIRERKDKILSRMKQRGLDQLVIYGDVEHGSNFEYLVGYFTRFEESLLVINADGAMTLVLGNENLNKASKSRVAAAAIHASLFSLPNQPNRKDKSLKELLMEAGIRAGKRIGIVGWKLFTSEREDNKKMYDVPSFIIDTIRSITGNEELISNETDLFIGGNGARITNNANEIAHYEYGASLASDCILEAMNRLEPGVSELELGDALLRYGQHPSIVTIAASGPRFQKANMFPTNNTVKIGDPISLTVGYPGGSSSRAGYAVHSADELLKGTKDYVAQVAAPYFAAYACWLQEIKIQMPGGELFDRVEAVLPRDRYHWSLCPGHLTAEEEWMASPIYEGSKIKLQSGMILQIDIIPAVEGYAGVSAESTVALADEKLKEEIRENYPKLWERIKKRRSYITDILGIELSADVLPMCSTVAYLRPYMLNKGAAFQLSKQ